MAVSKPFSGKAGYSIRLDLGMAVEIRAKYARGIMIRLTGTQLMWTRSDYRAREDDNIRVSEGSAVSHLYFALSFSLKTGCLSFSKPFSGRDGYRVRRMASWFV